MNKSDAEFKIKQLKNNLLICRKYISDTERQIRKVKKENGITDKE